MTEILGPCGVIRIDEGHVWRELSRWLDRHRDQGGDVVLRSIDATGFSCRLFVGT